MSMAELEADRQAIVTSGMQLSDVDPEKFGPVYKAYAENQGCLTKGQATTLIKHYMKLDSDRAKVRNE